MRIAELKEFILHNIKVRPDVFIRKHPSQYADILKRTTNLPESTPLRQRYYHVLYGITEIPSCLKCNNPVAWNPTLKKYRDFCSTVCSSNAVEIQEKRKNTCNVRFGGNAPACSKTIQSKMKQTSIQRHGVDNFNNRKKAKETCNDKHGVDNPSQLPDVKIKKQETCLRNHDVNYALQSSKIRERVIATCESRFGVSNPQQSKIVKDKTISTCLLKYGFKTPLMHPDVKKKIKQTNIEKYGVPYTSQLHISPETMQLLNDVEWLIEQHHVNELTLTEIGNKLKVNTSTVSDYFKKYLITIKRFSASAPEREIVRFIEDLDIVCETGSYSIIPPYQLDIFIPEYDIAIEYNGLYWHSEKNDTDEKYHLMKTEMCEAKGIRLIHIFEDEWRDQQQQCKDTLKHFFGKSEKGVYARKTTIKEIPWKVAKDFLNTYHLLGAGTSGNYRIGAFYEDVLIGVMVFGQLNNEGSGDNIELKRFVTDKNNNPGLGSKMFKYAVRNKQYSEVIAFVDRRWFTGLVKNHIGFKVVGKSKPALWWTNGTDRCHRRFQTKKSLIAQGANSLLTKRQMLSELGYYRIWDSGKLKCRWVNTS